VPQSRYILSSVTDEATAVECTRLDVAETERDRNKYDIAITLAAVGGLLLGCAKSRTSSCVHDQGAVRRSNYTGSTVGSTNCLTLLLLTQHFDPTLPSPIFSIPPCYFDAIGIQDSLLPLWPLCDLLMRPEP
jgi:hypothetical protein